MISIFIPVYNEESILKRNLSKVQKHLNELNIPFEIFVVDDGSTDNTKELCKDLERKYENFHYLYYPNGPSRRENLAKSFNRANSDIILFMDSDLATDLNYIKNLIDYINEGYDIATGSRFMGLKPQRDYSRKIISILYNSFLHYYFKSKIKDHQCGFKAFRKKVILALANKAGYDTSLKRGWFWDAEILIRAQKMKYKIKEFPVKWKSGLKSSFKITRELNLLYFIFKYGSKIKKNKKLSNG